MTSHARLSLGDGQAVRRKRRGVTIDAGEDGRDRQHDVREGDPITLDGGTGVVYIGEVKLVPPQINEDFETVLGWADGFRRLKVRANADTPEDAAKAREFGAEGIGLCRTEHMFFGEERLPHVQEMIMAEDSPGGRRRLDRLLPIQQSDFEGIFEAMAGLPSRFGLDPPLHEFLPAEEDVLATSGCAAASALREANPDAGDARLRLGIMFPEIYEMQVRAIVRAALAVSERSGGTARRDHAPARRLRQRSCAGCVS
jgi:pyruvate,orthophosphate dikinase